ncbi:gp58-like family protein [Lactiplantibacillus plantarum]|uniref:gp58-like family protein n=1 Tax=Lactiplantibacillus plantarum TaxID=1590 RepID=UPI0020BE4BD8|nr:gp58-like family protein [Lactiplantibacillus plantarum]
MIKQSDLALAAWKATERTLDSVVTINKIDYKTTDIASISYDAGGYTGDTFGIGSNYENSVTIKFSHLIEGLKPGMTVLPKIGIKTSNGYEYSSLGLFIVSDDIQMDRNNDETTIKAYDQMCLLEGTYTSKLTYPAKMTSVIAEIANLAGVLLNTTDISHLPVQVNLPSAITGQTYRNAIGMIAQFYAGFATFDRDGKLTIRTIAESDYTLDPSQYEQGGLTKNEAPYKIGGIQCEVTTTTTDSTGQSTETTNTLQVGATSGSQIKLTNNLMTMDRLASIWQQLQSLTFYPFSLNWFGNPAIEAGDWLTLQDTKGNKFNVPNNGYTMTFDGSLSAVSKADQTSTSSSSYAWRGELSQYVADLGGRQGASGNYIYGTDTTEPPYGAKFNDIWYKQNGNKVELWTYERQTDGTGKWVLTVSDTTGEEVKAKVDQVELEAKAGIDTAKAAIDKAARLAAKYDDTNALANQAMDKAVGAQSDASSAAAKANSTASEFGKVDQKAESALASALGAQSDASVAVKQASSAAADSKDAKQIAGAVSQSYKTLTDGSTMTIAELENGLATKLTKTDLDGYATETWTQNQIKVTADGINATLSSVKSTVDGQTTSINDLKADSSSFKSQFTTVNNTLGKHTTDISSLQATSKELTSGFNTLTTDNATNKNDISQLRQTATELSSTLMTVQTQVQDSAVGANILLNTGDDNDVDHPVKMTTGDMSVAGFLSRTEDYSQVTAPPSTSSEMYYRFGGPITNEMHGLEPGKTYTIQGDVSVSKGSVRFRSQRMTTGGWANYDTCISGILVSDSDSFVHVSYTFTIPDDATAIYTSWQVEGYDSTTILRFRRMKLEKGSVATDFSVNPEDTATVTAFSKLSQTVDGMQLDISKKIEQKDLNGYATQTWTQNQIKLTSDSLSATLSSVKSAVDGHTTSINALQADSRGFKAQFTDITDTVGKHTTDIGTLQASAKSLSASFNSLDADNKTNKHDISQLQLDAKSFSSTITTVQKLVTDVSSISQTVESIQTTVSGKVDNSDYQSKVEQLSSQITSVVGQVSTFGTRNFVTNSQFQYDYLDGTSWTGGTTAIWYRSPNAWACVNGYQGICTNQPVSTDTNVWYSLFSRKYVIGPDLSIPWSASAYVNVDTVGFNTMLIVEFYNNNGDRIGYKQTLKNSRGLELIKVENINPPFGTETVCLSFRVHGGGHIAMICPMLNQGTTAASFVPDNASDAQIQHAYSAILQTQDRINLRVEKNGVINAINISPEGIQIYGNKLHITSTTFIDEAVIKDGMIANLSANKLTAGTINAAHINVINLNANNITTGTIKGSRLSINLNTGNVEFQAGRIHSTDNGIDININNKYISVANKDNRVFISGGEIQMIQPTLFSSQSSPYVRISNAQAGASWGGATFWGRDYFVVTNGSNDGNIFTSPMGEEKFAGISGGHATSGWQPTKIGGAERGVLISGGREFVDGIGISPYIRVGDTGHAGTGMSGSNITMQGNFIYIKTPHTTSYGSNVHLAPDGALQESTSAAKYKTEIVRSFETPMGDKLIEVPVAHWKDKEEVLAKTLDPNAKTPETYFGMIADDLDDAGLNELVEYDDRGNVRGIQYDRVALALIPLIRNYRDRISEIENEVKQMKEV